MGFFYPQWQKIIRIGVTTPPTTTGYQVKVTIAWQPGMKDDFSDLRFSDYYRTLPYWIETSTTRVTATVWIKLTEINEAAREFFCYYGNGQATSESSGTDVFEFFDDFLGSDINTSIWTTHDGTHSCANSILSHKNTSYNTVQKIASAATFGTGYGMIIRSALQGVTVNYHSIGFYTATGYDISICNNGYEGGTINGHSYTTAASWDRTALVNPYDTAYHRYQINRISDSVVKFNADDSAYSELTAPLYIPTGNIPLVSRPYTTGAPYYNWYIDWIAVRIVTATEPTCTPAESGINTAFYQALLRAKHAIQESYPYTLAVSFVTDHMHLTWTEP